MYKICVLLVWLITLSLALSQLTRANDKLYAINEPLHTSTTAINQNLQQKNQTKLVQADNIRSNDPEQFNQLLAQLNKNRALLTKEQQYYLQYLNGYQLAFQGDFQQAFTVLKQLTNTTVKKDLKFRAKLTIINALTGMQNWPQGLIYLTQVLELIPTIIEPKNKKLALMVIPIFYNQLGQYQLGLRYAKKLKQISMKTNDKRSLCYAAQLSLEAQYYLDQLLPFSAQIFQGIKTCQVANEVIATNLIRAYLAQLYVKNEQINKALTLLTDNYNEIQASHYPLLLSEINVILAKIFWLKEDLPQAEHYAFQAILQAKRLKTTKQIINAYYLLYQINLKQQKYQQALNYHKKYTQANKTYLDEVQAKALAFQLAKNKDQQQTQQIALLNKQNRLLNVQKKLAQTQQENERLFIAMLIAIVTLLLFWGYKTLSTQKQLRLLAEYDALTGIFNRGHFTQIASTAIEHCQKNKQPISCVLFDLDNFKNINDSYGHTCGDWVLKEVVKACQKVIRTNDIFARLGGEEFCILLPNCDLNKAEKLSEHYRKMIAYIDTKATGHNFKVTASFGITSNKVSGYDLNMLINDADHAMYQSKNSGKNQLTLFDNKVES
jgi:diguanylate cyclase (GGDEF)-like protein